MSHKCKVRNTEGLEIESETYIWIRFSKDLTKENARNLINVYHTNTFRTWEEYEGYSNNCCVIMFNANNSRWFGSCYDHGRKYICSHSMTVDHLTNCRKIPEDYRNTTIVASRGKYLGAPTKHNRHGPSMPAFIPPERPNLVMSGELSSIISSQYCLLPSPIADLSTLASGRRKVEMYHNSHANSTFGDDVFNNLPSRHLTNDWMDVQSFYNLTDEEVVQLQYFRDHDISSLPKVFNDAAADTFIDDSHYR